jgi:hypothetical protein
VQVVVDALHGVVSKPAAANALAQLRISGFETPDLAVYQRCIDMERSAINSGYPHLA